jgi:hypothetical protein
MKLCQEHPYIVVYADHFDSCPVCSSYRKYDDLEAELKEVKADLTELNLKMAPDYEGIIESRKEMKEKRQEIRDDHPELILDK